MDSSNSRSPHLLGIPKEIRLRIYELLIRDGKFVIPNPSQGSQLEVVLRRLNLESAQDRPLFVQWKVNACTSIMQVCKSLRKETFELFIKATTMIQVPYLSQLRGITKPIRSPLQHVKVIEIIQNQWDAEFDYGLFPCLEMIHVKNVDMKSSVVPLPSLTGGSGHIEFMKRVRAAHDNYALVVRERLIEKDEGLAAFWGQKRAETLHLLKYFNKVKPGILCVADINLASYRGPEDVTQFSILDIEDCKITAMAVSDFSHATMTGAEIDRW
jgi:hypothetical protein